jgi:hypothetical protein
MIRIKYSFRDTFIEWCGADNLTLHCTCREPSLHLECPRLGVTTGTPLLAAGAGLVAPLLNHACQKHVISLSLVLRTSSSVQTQIIKFFSLAPWQSNGGISCQWPPNARKMVRTTALFSGALMKWIIYLHAIVVCSPSCMINIIAARLLYSMHTDYSAYLHKT